jgi:hypothetical protein
MVTVLPYDKLFFIAYILEVFSYDSRLLQKMYNWWLIVTMAVNEQTDT